MKKSKSKLKKSKERKNFIFLISIFLILILSFTVLFTGCKKEEKKKVTAEGLSLNFVMESPPSQVSINQKFPIYAEITNTGDYDLPPNAAMFYLQGLGTNVKGYTSKLQNANVIEKNIGKERIVFAREAYSDLPITTPFNITMSMMACYEYVTNVQAHVCLAQKTSDICAIEGNKITDNSNSKAPVKITSLTQSVIGKNLRIEFIIQNVGDGQLYLPSADCDGIARADPLQATKKNYVNVEVYDGGAGFSCSLLNEEMSSIRGLKGIAQNRVICEKMLAEGENYLKPIQIVLKYKYVSSISQKLTILPY